MGENITRYLQPDGPVSPERLTARREILTIIDELNAWNITDTETITRAARQIINTYPVEWRLFLDGKDKLLGFFIGKLLKVRCYDPKKTRGILLNMKEGG